MTRLSLLILTLLVCLPAQSGVYRWVDAAGVVRYADGPPAEGEFEKLPAKPSQRPPGSVATTRLEQLQAETMKIEAREAQEEAQRADLEREAAMADERARYCLKARDNLKLLTDHPANLVTVDKQSGQRTRVSEDQRQSKMQRARKDVEYFCEG